MTRSRTQTQNPTVAPSPAQSQAPVPGTPVDGQESFEQKMARLAASGTEQEAQQDQTRPQIKPTAEMLSLGLRWAEGKALDEIVGKSVKKDGDKLDEMCFKEWVNALWFAKSKPLNPELKLGANIQEPDIELVYQVKDEFKVKPPKRPIPIEANVLRTLTEKFNGLGMAEGDASTDAKGITEKALKFTLIPYVKLPHECVTAEEVAAANKYLDLMNWDGISPPPAALTAQEKKLIVTSKWEVSVKENALATICGIVRSREQLSAVFDVIVPSTALSKPNFNKSLTPEKLEVVGKRIIADSKTDEDDEE